MAASQARRLILTVGMHRSGTSLLSSLLAGLGVTLPGRLIPADAANPEGYHEWDRVVNLQEHLLVELDRWWPAEEGLQPLPEGWLEHHATRRTRRELVELLSIQLQGQGPWAVKDPRTSLLLPLWRSVAAELDLNLQLVLALRHPAEVAASLIHRDGPLVGTDLHRALGLWLRHTNAVLEDGRGLPLAVVDYGDWFRDGSGQLQRLVQALGLDGAGPERQQEVLERVRPEHRRHRQGSAGVDLDPTLRRLYRDWRRLARGSRWRARRTAAPAGLRRHCRLSVAELSAAPETWPQLVEAWSAWPAPADPGPGRLAPKAVVAAGGLSSFDWSFHSWLQRLPLADLATAAPDPADQHPHRVALISPAASETQPDALERLAINLELPPATRVHQWLEHLRHQSLVWDPHPGRVRLLRRLGINAYVLDASGEANGWLQSREAHDDLQQQASVLLGLPPVQALQDLGIAVMALGDGGPRWHGPLPRSVGSIPGFDNLQRPTVQHARCTAAWLQAVQQSGIQLVWLGAQDSFWPQQGWAALQRHPGLLPPQRFLGELDPDAIQQELAWRSSGRPEPAHPDTPQPSWDVLANWEDPKGAPPTVAVCISLHNYADRIVTALESVRQQQQPSVELIVVDDASDDDGVAQVQDWLQAHGAGFRRARLLRHHRNGGLAAARNTAFSLAQAPWCFVLDADNRLEPEALSSSLAVARHGGSDVAVVHGLLAVWDEGRGTTAGLLGGGRPWQPEALRPANQIDAMALIRRDAWQQVGGYTHIPGGWEDYDFWCCLIDAGYRGVLCPRVLATYVRHGGSMIHRSTDQQLRPISRLLQWRHPWLQLPYAGPEA